VLRLALQRDDGAVIHLNGIEVVRSNMRDGTHNFLTFALEDVVGEDEHTFFTHLLDATPLRAGTNWIAAEIHQSINTSPDLRFDLRREGLRLPTPPPTAPPVLDIGFLDGTLRLRVAGSAGQEGWLETSDDLVRWDRDRRVVIPADGILRLDPFQPGPEPASPRFYRVGME
jgi:hypothetical protein